jgi:UDP-N-acetylmuramyl pentapeptide phosphotransferase/UDP-N-acetylglucosamine-1-phosphate transferase
MSFVTLGIFLTISKDLNYAMIAFALAGALLGFLYFNFNPARIFMGDTGSLVLGFDHCCFMCAVNENKFHTSFTGGSEYLCFYIRHCNDPCI